MNSKRPLSWSSIALFNWSKEEWAKKYILNLPQKSSPEMEFGKLVDTKLQTDPSFLPLVPRLKDFQKCLKGSICKDFSMIGYFDAFELSKDKKSAKLGEYKTSSSDIKWTQKSAEEHGQILFYLLLIWLKYKIPPENVPCFLTYIPVHKKETGDFKVSMHISRAKPKTFHFKHTTLEVIQFGRYVMDIYKKMEKFSTEYKKKHLASS
jgi:hypothetical protein